jgi:hypothetical protein
VNHRIIALPGVDWQAVAARPVSLSRFVIPLHDLDPRLIFGPATDHDDPVLAFSRWPDSGEVWVSDGRHRLLRALLAGRRTVYTRLLVIS